MSKLITSGAELRDRRERPDGRERPAPGAASWLRELYSPALVIGAVYVALAILVFNQVWRDLGGATLGGGAGDGGLFIWYIRWTAHAVTHGLNPLHSGFLNVPDGVNVMWNTSVLLPSLLLAPVTLLLGPVVSFNLMLTGALAGSAFTGYLAARRFVRNHVAAAAGGLVYGFSPAILAQSLGHLHMTLMVLPPLLLLLLHHVLVRQRRPAVHVGAALGFGTFCQLLTGEEVLAFTVITGLVLVIVLVSLYPREVLPRARYALRALGVALAVFLPLAAWPLATQLFGSQKVNGNIQEGVRLASDLLGFFLPTANQLVAPSAALEISRDFAGSAAELNAYVGVPLLAVAAYTAARWWRSPIVRVATIMTAAVMVLSLGSVLHVGGAVTGAAMPWGLVDELPLLESAVPNRLMLFAWPFIGLLLAVFVDRLAGVRDQRAWVLVAAAAVVLSLLPQGGVPAEPVRGADYFAGDAVERIPAGATALIVPVPTRAESIAMYWQAEAGMRFKMPGAYSIVPGPTGSPQFGPEGTRTFSILVQVASGARATRVAGDLRRDLVADLEAWDVRAIVLGPMRSGQEGARARLLELLTGLVGRAPEQIGDVYLWADVDPVALRETEAAEEVGAPEGEGAPPAEQAEAPAG